MLYAGIVPYINASIILQLLTTSFPSLKKLQREEGPQGRARFQLYQKLAALGFAGGQSVGQLTYIRPYVSDFSTDWLITNSVTLTAGAMILVHVSVLHRLFVVPQALLSVDSALFGWSLRVLTFQRQS